jgi:hypothetical protein
MRYVNERDVAHLGPILLPHVTQLGDDRMLSPGREAAPHASVYLLHGTDDNVIPAIESFLLADALRSRGVTVHQLATPLITHAEVDRSATASAMFRLVGFATCVRVNRSGIRDPESTLWLPVSRLLPRPVAKLARSNAVVVMGQSGHASGDRLLADRFAHVPHRRFRPSRTTIDSMACGAPVPSITFSSLTLAGCVLRPSMTMPFDRRSRSIVRHAEHLHRTRARPRGSGE